MPLIDTPARHAAALKEARRLIALVLANNGAYRALQSCHPDRDRARMAQLAGELAADQIYRAFTALGEALAAMEPPPVADADAAGRPLAERISLIPEPMPVALLLAEPLPEAVQNGTPPAAGEAAREVAPIWLVQVRAGGRLPLHDEAKVAIVHPDKGTGPGAGSESGAVTGAAAVPPARAVNRREGLQRSLFRLFR